MKTSQKPRSQLWNPLFRLPNDLCLQILSFLPKSNDGHHLMKLRAISHRWNDMIQNQVRLDIGITGPAPFLTQLRHLHLVKKNYAHMDPKDAIADLYCILRTVAHSENLTLRLECEPAQYEYLIHHLLPYTDRLKSIEMQLLRAFTATRLIIFPRLTHLEVIGGLQLQSIHFIERSAECELDVLELHGCNAVPLEHADQLIKSASRTLRKLLVDISSPFLNAISTQQVTCMNLSSLECYDCNDLLDRDIINAVKNLRNLQVLKIFGCGALRRLEFNHPHLQQLELGACEALEFIVGVFMKLRRLHLSNQLTLSATNVNYLLEQNPEIQYLSASIAFPHEHEPLEAEVMDFQLVGPNLETLELYGARAPDINLPLDHLIEFALEHCPVLRSLALIDINFHQLNAKSTSLEQLFFFACRGRLDEAATTITSQCPNLLAIKFEECPEIKFPEIRGHRLQSAVFTYCPELSDEALTFLRNHAENLATIGIYDSSALVEWHDGVYDFQYGHFTDELGFQVPFEC